MNVSFKSLVILICVGLISVGCGSTPRSGIPTATPAPLVLPATSTPTFVPPPTVTLYPTATPRGSDSGNIVVTATSGSTLGASVSSGGEGSQSQPPVSQPTATQTVPTPTIAPSQEDLPSGIVVGDQIFVADFFRGWPTIDEAGAHIMLDNGQYRFEVGPFNAKFLYTTAVNQADLYVSVEATAEECPVRGGFGLMYRYVDSNNYYLATVFCDNTYTVVARINGSILGIVNGTLPSNIKLAAGQTYKLSVSAKKDSFALFVNNQAISEFSDNQLKQGDVALYVASQGNNVTRILFDNLKVWAVR